MITMYKSRVNTKAMHSWLSDRSEQMLEYNWQVLST